MSVIVRVILPMSLPLNITDEIILRGKCFNMVLYITTTDRRDEGKQFKLQNSDEQAHKILHFQSAKNKSFTFGKDYHL